MQTSDEPADFTRLDDSALLSWRARARTELERLPLRSASREALSALYDASLDELVERVETLLADPESLGNDALETDLYILRDQLRTGPDAADEAASHTGKEIALSD